jgi:tetratricopeptide (TPR) repeat protein
MASGATTTATSTTRECPLPDFDKLWDYSDSGATEAKFRELLPGAEQSGDRSYLLQLLTQLARTLGLQRKFEQAHAILHRVDAELRKEDSTGLEVVRVRYLLERGRAFNSAGEPRRAMPLLLEAVEVGRNAKLPRYEVDAIHMLAIAAPTADERITWGVKGVARAMELNEIGWLHALYNNLGEEYRARKQYDKALECFRGVIESNKHLGRPVDRYARVDEAKMLRMLGHADQSLVKMTELRSELKGTGDVDDAFVCEELAEAMLALGRPDEAEPLFRIAHQKLKDDQWLQRHEPQRLQRLKDMTAGQ